jgi:undecaprenyl-diphosphatase
MRTDERDADTPGDAPTRFVRVRDRPSPAVVAVTMVIASTVVAITAVAAHDGNVSSLEGNVLVWVSGWPDALEPAMWAIQQFGMLFATLAVGAVVAICGRRWTLAVPFVLVIPLKLFVERAIVKLFVDRERPYVSFRDDIIVRGGNFDGLSYPSGHALTAFAIAVLIASVLPPVWRPAPIVWAVLVGVARLYMGEHNLYDVVAGAALGAMFGVLLWYSVMAHPAIAGHPVSTRGLSRSRTDPRPSM